MSSTPASLQLVEHWYDDCWRTRTHQDRDFVELVDEFVVEEHGYCCWSCWAGGAHSESSDDWRRKDNFGESDSGAVASGETHGLLKCGYVVGQNAERTLGKEAKRPALGSCGSAAHILVDFFQMTCAAACLEIEPPDHQVSTQLAPWGDDHYCANLLVSVISCAVVAPVHVIVLVLVGATWARTLILACCVS